VKLPHGDRAYIGDKLERYVLSSENDCGKPKARGFAVVLGITPERQQLLRDALVEAAAVSDEAVPQPDLGFGARFRLDFELHTATGAAIVRSAWILRTSEDFPRLVTCYILKPL
jgi:hypothetical protein